MRQHLTVARVAEGLEVAWNIANDAVLIEGKRVLIDDVARFDGVKVVIGVDEHVWTHSLRGDKYVTVITDLTGNRDGTGPDPAHRSRPAHRQTEPPTRCPRSRQTITCRSRRPGGSTSA